MYCRSRADSSDSADLPCDQLPEVGLGSQRERLVINLEKHIAGQGGKCFIFNFYVVI